MAEEKMNPASARRTRMALARELVGTKPVRSAA
jgi:hypothetical protein